ncbi:acyl-CoA dehydrogenase [Aquipuribacter sp. SD81]|uniref:acyl-CoA dehydrogenase n=1 Tax=Aquipuribacter sp. SD81 TaxID=3127703 RepID=UPI003019CFF3
MDDVTVTTGARVRDLLDTGRLDLPLPGRGRTALRLARLRELGEDDLVVARLAEAHTDALHILTDLADPPVDGRVPGGGLLDGADRHLWGVWAADPPGASLRAEHDPASGRWSVSGPKPWCSGATTCDRALVTAHAHDGYRLLALDPRHPGVTVRPSAWAGPGMAGSDTRDLHLDTVAAEPVGAPGAYLDRTGFWWGAAGVAAVWLGGARRVARTLHRVAARHRSDLALASLARVDAAQHAAWATLLVVADLADRASGPGPGHAAGREDGREDGDGVEVGTGAARLAAARARAAVETAVEVTLLETARTCGPGPLATDAEHARAVADLTVYVRQSHGDRDLAVLGGLVLDARDEA